MTGRTIFILVALGVVALIFLASRGVKLFAAAIAYAEGYGVPGAIPTLRNNPGDLKLPSSGGAITTFATPADGWAALYRQLDLIVSGRSAHYSIDMTIGQMGSIWTATEQSAWTQNVVAYLRSHGVNATSVTKLREVLI